MMEFFSEESAGKQSNHTPTKSYLIYRNVDRVRSG